MPKRVRTAFDVSLSASQREKLAIWLSQELDYALAARTSDQEIEYYHTLYEQGRTRGARNSPWPDAADFTSAIGTEKVDALKARIVKTIFTEQIWTVEGVGESAEKAPFVEEFHQWQAEAEGFQAAFAQAVHLSLLEPRGVLEVYEDRVRRPIRRTIRAQLATASTGEVIVGEALTPQFVRGSDGGFQVVSGPDPATGQEAPSAEVAMDAFEFVANGPRERVIPSRHFLVLPGNATERADIWGYAKRFYRRLDQLAERVRHEDYDAEAVAALGTEDERAQDTTLSGIPISVPPKSGPLAEKELWEVTLLADLSLILDEYRKPELRWYVTTIHKDKQQILRWKYDEIGRPRYFCITPFPKPNSTEGYIFLGNKLITVIEENTAWRNMLADRASIEVQVPMKRRQGSLWDPDEEPFGAKAVMTVRDMDEVQPFQIPQMTAPARERIIDTERQAEKLAGLTDIASGVNPNEDRTLGENQMVVFNSEIRIDEVVKNVQEPLEEIAQVRHLMWKRALAEREDGVELPESRLIGLETRGVDITRQMPDARVTAALLEGTYRFKPKGSVETADKERSKRVFNESLSSLAQLSQVNVMIGTLLQQPVVAKALLEKWAYLYNVDDKRAFLGADAMRLLQPQPQVMPPGIMPGPPGLPAQPTMPPPSVMARAPGPAPAPSSSGVVQ